MLVLEKFKKESERKIGSCAGFLGIMDRIKVCTYLFT